MPADGDLARLRGEMDEINRRLLAVLNERARHVRTIGAWKRAHGVAAVDEERETTMLAALLRDAPADGYAEADLRDILTAVFRASRRLAGDDD